MLSKKAYDELKIAVRKIDNDQRKDKDFKNHGQFKRKRKLSSNNILETLTKEILRTPLRENEIAKDKDGKFLYKKDGTLKRKLKK